ncbi:hypothetical protein LJB42_002805 [Komagataella kurtzmanii]|nr:hypothetical protein LJB42_002805 [Komagataella kurtzmanii]
MRKRSSSKSTSNYQPIRRDPPELTTKLHVVKLVPLNKSFELVKVLVVPDYPKELELGRQAGSRAGTSLTNAYFASRTLSRSHASLFVKEGKLYVRDLKSSNGTFINDVRLEHKKEYLLNVGDELTLGSTLESQPLHKKIQVKVEKFLTMNLQEYEDLVQGLVIDNDERKAELFNDTLDALLFSDALDSEDKILDALVAGDPNLDSLEVEPTVPTPGVSPSPNLKGITLLEDVTRRLIISINNENIQHQKLLAMGQFLDEYLNHEFSNGKSSSKETKQSGVSQEDHDRLFKEMEKLALENELLKSQITSKDEEEDYDISSEEEMDDRRRLEKEIVESINSITNSKQNGKVATALTNLLEDVKGENVKDDAVVPEANESASEIIHDEVEDSRHSQHEPYKDCSIQTDSFNTVTPKDTVKNGSRNHLTIPILIAVIILLLAYDLRNNSSL